MTPILPLLLLLTITTTAHAEKPSRRTLIQEGQQNLDVLRDKYLENFEEGKNTIYKQRVLPQLGYSVEYPRLVYMRVLLLNMDSTIHPMETSQVCRIPMDQIRIIFLSTQRSSRCQQQWKWCRKNGQTFRGSQTTMISTNPLISHLSENWTT